MSSENPGFGSGEGEEDFGIDWDRLTPEDEALIEEVSIPVNMRAPSHIAEVATDFQYRLGLMRIENPKIATKWKLRELESLYLYPYALEDVHYSVYEKRREKSPSPFLAITFNDVVEAAPTNVTNLQIRQNFEAYLMLVDHGIQSEPVYDWVTKGTPEEKYRVRSLSRLLKEKYLLDFAARLSQEANLRGAERPLTFEEVCGRALRILERQSEAHNSLDTGQMDTDARMWHLLVSRDLERSKSFALPLLGIIAPKTSLDN